MRRSTTIIGMTAIVSLYACGSTSSTGEGGSSVNTTPAFATGTGVATLSWAPPTRNLDSSALDDLAGYYIYYGKDPAALNGEIRIFDPLATTHTVDHLAPGTYYFRVIAVTGKGVKGGGSPLVSKTIP